MLKEWLWRLLPRVGNTSPRVGILDPSALKIAPGPWVAKSTLLGNISILGGCISQYIPPLGSVRIYYFDQLFKASIKNHWITIQIWGILQCVVSSLPPVSPSHSCLPFASTVHQTTLYYIMAVGALHCVTLNDPGREEGRRITYMTWSFHREQIGSLNEFVTLVPSDQNDHSADHFDQDHQLKSTSPWYWLTAFVLSFLVVWDTRQARGAWLRSV